MVWVYDDPVGLRGGRQGVNGRHVIRERPLSETRPSVAMTIPDRDNLGV